MPSSLAAASATARQFLPATNTCTGCPSALAAVSALGVASLRTLLSCSARRSVVMSTCLPSWGVMLRARATVPRLEGQNRLHDVRQAGIARLVETQIGGHDRRAFEFDRLQSAIDLARDQKAIALDQQFRCKGALRPAGERRQHLPGLIAVVVNRLLAHDDETGLLLLDDGLEDLSDRERLERLVRLHQNTAVGSHRQAGADGLGRLRRADRHANDLGRLALLFEPQRLLDGDLVEGIHGHLDIRQFDAAAVALDANFDVVVDDPLHGHQNFHEIRSRDDSLGGPGRQRRGNLMAAALQCQRRSVSLAARAAGLGPICTTVSGTGCRHWNSLTARGLSNGNSTAPPSMPPKWHQ